MTSLSQTELGGLKNFSIFVVAPLFLVAYLILASVFPAISPIQHGNASTNTNLYVSAENSQWNNYFAGPQVIQVVVTDPDINRLDQAYGEPVVTVNGKRLRMAQGTDGNWYAYFADRNQAIAASNTAVLSGKGLNFGGFCGPNSSFTPKSGVTYTDTKGFTLARGGFGSTNHTAGTITSGGLPNCSNNDVGTLTGNQMEHVVRQNKTLNQISTGFNAGTTYQQVWPVIQLYDFSAIPSAVTVDYQKSGGDQTVNLTFDRIPQNLITPTVDRNAYPQNSQVFVQVNDPQLNIDPTEEDSWTWGTNVKNNTVYYEVFTRNGAPDADGTAGMVNLYNSLTTLMFNHNGKLTLDPAPQGVRMIDFQANSKIVYNGIQRGDPAAVRTASISPQSQPLTLVESGGVDTGIFVNWDGGKKSEIVTVDNPNIRGNSAVVKYNDISSSIVGGFSFALLTQNAQNNNWASGQRIPVILTDNDENKNSKLSEGISLWDPTYKRQPTMVIGTPFTLSSGGAAAETAVIASMATVSTTGGKGSVTFGGSNAVATNIQEDEQFSSRPIFNFINSSMGQETSISSTSALLVDVKTTMDTLLKTIHNTNRTNNSENFKGFNFLNYDLRSFSGHNGATGDSISDVGIYLVYNNAGTSLTDNNGLPVANSSVISIANSTSLQDFINLNVTSSKVANPALLNENLFSNVKKTASIGLLFTFTTHHGSNMVLSTNGQPMVADFFSIGIIGDGTQNSQRINNGIYRYELGETGENTGVFTGTNQYVMLNQLNIFDPNTYSNLRPIQHDVYFPVIQDMLQSEASAPQITYFDLGQDGVNTEVSAQQDIQTHTGVISFDGKTYKIGDTVTVTLQDSDLNVNNDLVDIYTVVNQPNDVAYNTVGMRGLGTYSDNSPFGSLLKIKYDGMPWNNNSCFVEATTAGGFETDLANTGFSLVETGQSTGIFTGTFVVPDQYCFNSGTSISTYGSTISVDYFDFADSKGKTTVTSSSAVVGDQQGVPSKNLRILFQSGYFTPKQGINFQAITNSSQDGVVHYLVQFDELPTLDEVKILANQGINLLEYASGNAYIASSKVSDLNVLSNLNTSNLNHMRWIGPLQKQYKISNDIVNNKIPIWANGGNGTVVFTIKLHENANMSKVLSHMNQLGSRIVFVKEVPSISGYFNVSDVDEIANDDNVQFVDFADPKLVAANDKARQNSGVEMLHGMQSTTGGLLGKGVTIFEYDVAPADPNHAALKSSLKNPSSNSFTPDQHSTHVAGILVGSGVGSNCSSFADPIHTCPSGGDTYHWQGMAPGANLISLGEDTTQSGEIFLYDNYDDLTTKFKEAIQLTNATPGTATSSIAQPIDLVSMSLASEIGNLQSFGCDKLSTYPVSSQYLDEIVKGVLGNPMIFFESAGDERSQSCQPVSYGSINPPATAKDVITVGAIHASDNSTENDSSFGPTSDGRIKPDIVAPGSRDEQMGLISTISGPGSKYGTMTGTSMATPVAAGATALLIEEWRNVHNSATRPMPHTVKAILIHTANNPNGMGADYAYGWGILNAVGAVNLIQNNDTAKSVYISQIENTNDQKSFTFANLGTDVKATLVWDDPPGTVNADHSNPSNALINNLDVKLVDSSNHFFDNSFICKRTSDCHEQGTDDKNNVKMVAAHGNSGDWTAIVTGTSITKGPQDFTLIVTSYEPNPGPSPPIITSPTNGAPITTDPVIVSGMASEGDVIQLSYGGAFKTTTASTDGSWNMPINLSSLGTYTLIAQDVTPTPSSLVSNSVTVTKSLGSAPTIESPIDGAKVTTNSITVTGTASTSDPVSVSGGSSTVNNIQVIGNKWTANVLLNQGVNDIVAQQMQSGIQVPSNSVSVYYFPAPKIVTPNDGDTMSSTPIIVSGSAYPQGQIQIFVNNTRVDFEQMPSNGTWSFSISLPSTTDVILVKQVLSGFEIDSSQITVHIDTSKIPEFPLISMMTFSIGIITAIYFGRKKIISHN